MVLTVENVGVMACSAVMSCNLVDRNYLAVFFIYRSLGGNSFFLCNVGIVLPNCMASPEKSTVSPVNGFHSNLG